VPPNYQGKADLIIANEEFEVIDEVSKIHLISSAIDEWKRYNEREFQLYLDMENLSVSKMGDVYKSWHEKLCRIMLSAISDFKVKGITPSEAKERCKSLGRDSILAWASDIYEIYDRRLKIGGYLDFDDMLYNAKKCWKPMSTFLRNTERNTPLCVKTRPRIQTIFKMKY